MSQSSRTLGRSGLEHLPAPVSSLHQVGRQHRGALLHCAAVPAFRFQQAWRVYAGSPQTA